MNIFLKSIVLKHFKIEINMKASIIANKKSLKNSLDKLINDIEQNIWVTEKLINPHKNNVLAVVKFEHLIPRNISPKKEKVNPIKINRK